MEKKRIWEKHKGRLKESFDFRSKERRKAVPAITRLECNSSTLATECKNVIGKKREKKIAKGVDVSVKTSKAGLFCEVVKKGGGGGESLLRYTSSGS